MGTLEQISQFSKSAFCQRHPNAQPEPEQESIDRKAIVSVISSYGIQFISIFLSFLTKIILARLVLPSAWGLFAEAILVLSIFEMVRDVGISQHLIRHPDPPYGNALIIELSMSAFFLCLIQLIAPWFSFLSPQISNILRVVFVAGFIKAFSVIPETYMYRNLLLKKSIPPSILSLLVNAGVSILLALRGYGVWSLVFGLILSTLVATIYYWVIFGKHIALEFTLKHSKALFSHSRCLFLIGAIGFLSSRSDIAIAGSLLNPQKTGYYFMAMSLILWPARVIEGALHNVLYPVFSKLKNDSRKMGSVYGLVTRLVLSIEAPIYIFVFFTADTIVFFLFGPKWAVIIPLVRILSFLAIIDPIAMFGLEILRSTGQDHILTWSSLLTFFSLTLGGWLLTSKYGIHGLAYSRFLILGSIPIILAVARTIKEEIQVLLRDILFMYLTLFLALGAINYLLMQNRILGVVLSAAMACVLFASFYMIFFKDKFRTARRILLDQSLVQETSQSA